METITFEYAINNVESIPTDLLLSKEDVKGLLTEWYINQVSSKILSKKYSISSKFYSYFNEIFFKLNKSCPNCKNLLYGHFPSKSLLLLAVKKIDMSSKLTFSDIGAECLTCGHSEGGFGLCSCEFCTNSRKNLEKEKQEAIERIDLSPTFKLSDLPLLDYIEMISWLKTYWSDNMTYIQSLENYDADVMDKIYNNLEKSDKVVEKFWEKNYISPSPTSRHSAFDFERIEDTLYATKFSLGNVNWELRFSFDDITKQKFIHQDWKRYFVENYAVNIVDNFEENDKINTKLEELYLIWKDLLLYDSLEYFKYRCKKLELDSGAGESPGDKTIAMFKELLEHWTLNEVYYFIWSATKDALAYKVSERVSKRQAANSVVGKIERMALRAKQREWNFIEFYRPKDLPSYGVAQILYSEILQLPREGFDTIPSVQYIDNLFFSEK
ncbi:hypothetical protein LMK04_08045 [Lactococcus petauri]|uniref:hypothetical protein n=1 Tax=Lactococcus lactis TaxID=1358 RepID=UPI002078F1A8|nr:hypothetical protein [Lactococcus lactis]MDG4989856.1 hypothetical protein [Lactococcus lactis]USI67434.1 hypothetical protein LMK04_08045 [Lactococcus petauri]